MQTYLVVHGANSEMNTFKADDVQHAREQCLDFLGLSQEDDPITEVMLCLPIIGAEDGGVLYACDNAGSWFGACDLSLVTVPENITDPDEIEDFIINHRDES